MFKNIQGKVILIFFLVGITLIGGLGAFYICSLSNIVSKIDSEQIVNVGQALEQINNLQLNAKISLGISIAIFIIAGIIISAFLSKYIIYPRNKMIESEETTQKNQLETILLHMTDGIIAFNREGEIILINPAAKKLLSIRPEDNTFNDIFSKLNLNINMEKPNHQIYSFLYFLLENHQVQYLPLP